MQINDILNGFKIKDIKEVEELKGRAIEMSHEKSGARLLWLDRPDNNKTFSIAFRTVPSDDTGIFHILEHSVLCGSKKFPLKEPFVELIKNSMNTFLNALTFSDKTMYPISSKNDKDFFNLMEVYLDAVFYPSIYTKPEIFYQEGWHYEFDEKDNISYKGVVFNEMKGVYADADSVMENQVDRALFPDNCYSCESGGHPTKIPSLTYQQFIDGHKKYYHPSNSYIILDGDLDIDKVTEFIDREYLSSFDAIEPSELPAIQKPVKGEMKEIFFEQSKDMPLENQSNLNNAYVVGTFDEKEKIYASHVLARYLCESNQSYLTNALMSKGYAEDVSLRIVDGILQPYASLEMKSIDEGKAEEINAYVVEVLENLCKNGVDKKQLEAAISNLEFELKEKDFGYPRGLMYAMLSLETWLYDGDPLANVIVGDVFEVLRQKAENGYFEELIRELFLDNNHSCSVLGKPSYTVGDEDREDENNRLEAIKSAWDKADIEYFKNEQARLDAWQSSVDSPEDLAKIPMITLEDIEVKPEPLPTVVDGSILKHSIQTDGIAYVNMYFDITGVTEEELPRLSLLSSLLGELDTEKHSAVDLKTELMTKCGNMSFVVSAYSKYNCNDTGKIKFVVSFSALNRYVSDALDLVKEIITSTKFTNENAILDIVKQLRQSKYQAMVMSGSMVASKHATTSICYDAVVDELTAGFGYYQWLKEQENNLTVVNELEAFTKSIFGRDNLIIGVGNDDANAFDKEINEFINSLGRSNVSHQLVIKPFEKSNDAIAIPGDISFSALACDFNGKYNGHTMLMAHIASLDYLWNEVRVKGGAYGTGLKPIPNGTLFAYSYRDPNAKGSVDTFGKISKYLKDFADSDKNLVGFIIGAMSSASPLMTPRIITSGGDVNYIRELDEETRLKTRQEIVSTTLEDISRLADDLEMAVKKGSFCVIGSQKQIEKFDELDKKYSL